MNKIKNSSMFLLWAGAAISITEIYTGGIIAPLGLQLGLLAIILGHIIGTAFLAFGGYICFKENKNAMESVKSSMGTYGAKIIAFLNVLQLLGWSAIMIIQGGRALSSVFPTLSLNMTIFIMAVLVFLWVYYFNNYSKLINDISVIALLLLCATLFFNLHNKTQIALPANINFATALELSIAMPVSWLPLIGDYTKNAKSKAGSYKYTFLGYFIGSVLMYTLGLFITIDTGKDIIQFIAGNNFSIIACIIIVLSTTTTTFLDIYSAVISSKQIFNIEKENKFIIIYSLLAAITAYIFPIEQYQNFLLTVGSVFIPIYTIVFLEYLFSSEREGKNLNIKGLVSASLGTVLYYYLTKSQYGSPTVIIIVVMMLLYLILFQNKLAEYIKNGFNRV
jgi:putative hydroxymethylpyrimidine transporter CytX